MEQKKTDLTLRDNETQHLIEFAYDRHQKILFVTYFDENDRAYKKSLKQVDNPDIIEFIEKVINVDLQLDEDSND